MMILPFPVDYPYRDDTILITLLGNDRSEIEKRCERDFFAFSAFFVSHVVVRAGDKIARR